MVTLDTGEVLRGAPPAALTSHQPPLAAMAIVAVPVLTLGADEATVLLVSRSQAEPGNEYWRQSLPSAKSRFAIALLVESHHLGNLDAAELLEAGSVVGILRGKKGRDRGADVLATRRKL